MDPFGGRTHAVRSLNSETAVKADVRLDADVGQLRPPATRWQPWQYLCRIGFNLTRQRLPVLFRHPAEPVKLGDPGLHTDYDLDPSVVATK